MLFGYKLSYLLSLATLVPFIGTCRANNYPPPPQNYSLPPDISPDRLFTIDTSVLAAPITTVGGNCTPLTQSLVRDGSITVILPTLDENTTESLDTIQTRALNESLPYILQQLGVKSKCIPDLVYEGVPLFKSIINDVLNSEVPANETTSLTRRDIFGDVGNFFTNVVNGVVGAAEGIANLANEALCEGFAAISVPGYQAAVFGFTFLNLQNPPQATTPDQNFYIHPLHGNIYKDNILVYYSAKFPIGFEKAIGTTIGRRIYMRAGRSVDGSDPNFFRVTRTLLHEFAHVKQYRSVGYDLSRFASQYLYNHCKAGFSYDNNIMEIDAKRQVNELRALFDPVGRQFFSIWKARNLGATLGLPTAKVYSRVSEGEKGITFSLRMQRGRMYITCQGPLQNPVCS
ncbi:hypothetical protein CPB86DRAFT_571164 [Serendipita vermifera]|nr:hypothetical protein CPB86DRAFT_571164 [Serendipita vermifera]